MSYEIIYEKHGLKLNDNEYVMFGEMGSNNCYEFTFGGRQRRERRGCIIPFGVNNKNHFILNKSNYKEEFKNYQKELFKKSIEQDKVNDLKNNSRFNDNYKSIDDVNYSWYTSIRVNNRLTSFNGAITIVKNIIENAYTFEELYNNGVKMYYIINKDRFEIETLEQLTTLVRGGVWIYVSNMPSERLKKRKAINIMFEKSGHVYAIKKDNDSYIDSFKKGKRNYKLMSIEDDEDPKLIFGSIEKAEMVAKEILNNYNYLSLKVVKIK